MKLNKYMTLSTIFIILISMMGTVFAAEPTHDDIMDGMDIFSKFKYEVTKLFGTGTTFSALGEMMGCDSYPDTVGSYIVDETYKHTVTCPGTDVHLVDLYTSSYHFIKEDIAPVTFTHNLIGTKYIYECYACPDRPPEPEPTPTDKCAGVQCNDYCVGTSLYTNGQCSSLTGSCSYTTQTKSATCGYVAPTPTYTPPVDPVIYPNPTTAQPDNTLVYVVLGFVSLMLVGLFAIGIIFIIKKLR